MNLKEFDYLDKVYMTKKERNLTTTIYSSTLISTLLLSVILKISLINTIGMVFVEGMTATLILYFICKKRMREINCCSYNSINDKITRGMVGLIK